MKSLRTTFTMVFIGSSLTLSALAQSAVYSCRDEHGNRSYSQTPCTAGTQSLEVKTLGRNSDTQVSKLGPKVGAEPVDPSQTAPASARRSNDMAQPARKNSPS